MVATKKKSSSKKPVVITLPVLGKSEIYKGLIVDESGKPLRHVMEIVGKFGNATWDKALDIAKKAGGALADRREGALLRASDPRGQSGLFWLSEQCEGYSDFAWAQYFNDGDQSTFRKSGKFRVRVVRTIPI